MRISDWSSDVCSSDLPRTRSTPSAAGWHLRAGARPRSLADVELRQRPGHRLQPEDRAHGGAHGVSIHDDDAALAYGRHLLGDRIGFRSEEHTSELQSLMRISSAVFCLKKQKTNYYTIKH